jgi:hypothetical protein
MPSVHRPAPHTAVMITIRMDRDKRVNMAVLSSDQRASIEYLLKFAETPLLHYPILLCLVTGPRIPLHCVGMLRSPRPLDGTRLDENFGSYYVAQVARTPALHDGALILSRSTKTAWYSVSGWSYRLIPPLEPRQAEANRGSAYNSAISMSLVENVDLVALVLPSGISASCSTGREAQSGTTGNSRAARTHAIRLEAGSGFHSRNENQCDPSQRDS